MNNYQIFFVQLRVNLMTALIQRYTMMVFLVFLVLDDALYGCKGAVSIGIQAGTELSKCVIFRT